MTDKILKFSATWCQPCKMLTQSLKNVDLSVPVEETDIDENRDLAIKFGIRGVPTLVYVRDDVEVARLVGMQMSGDVVDWVTKNKV